MSQMCYVNDQPGRISTFRYFILFSRNSTGQEIITWYWTREGERKGNRKIGKLQNWKCRFERVVPSTYKFYKGRWIIIWDGCSIKLSSTAKGSLFFPEGKRESQIRWKWGENWISFVSFYQNELFPEVHYSFLFSLRMKIILRIAVRH